MADGLLVAHRPVDLALAATSEACAVLQPELVPFVSYPYEWCFGQLRDAALLTLELQARALARGLTLRDASAYNVQFVDATPIFIDTLSFGRYREGEPWLAYRQFCEHFLAPLLLMVHHDARLGLLLRQHLDGVPLDLAARLLPPRTLLAPSALLHVHLHARAQRRYVGRSAAELRRGRTMSRAALLAMLDHLRRTIERLRWAPPASAWVDYDHTHRYTAEDVEAKERLVLDYLGRLGARSVWDFGANTGHYSRLARLRASSVVAFDADAAVVERAYQDARGSRTAAVLPLVMDLANPSPAQGWAGAERLSLEQRGPVDAVLALALVHHLAIAHHVPFGRIAAYFARLCTGLVVEFVPQEDPQVRRLLLNRAEGVASYGREDFEAAFAPCFRIEAAEPIGDSGRSLYLMRTRRPGDDRP